MTILLEIVIKFGDNPKWYCNEFINWYFTSTCGGTDASKFDLSPANCFSYKLLDKYKEFCIDVRFQGNERNSIQK